jgi:hypothetical protein
MAKKSFKYTATIVAQFATGAELKSPKDVAKAIKGLYSEYVPEDLEIAINNGEGEANTVAKVKVSVTVE